MGSSSSTSLRLGRRNPRLSLDPQTRLDLRTILGSSNTPSELHYLLRAGEQKGDIEDAILRFYSFFTQSDLSLASVEMEAVRLDTLSIFPEVLDLRYSDG